MHEVSAEAVHAIEKWAISPPEPLNTKLRTRPTCSPIVMAARGFPPPTAHTAVCPSSPASLSILEAHILTGPSTS